MNDSTKRIGLVLEGGGLRGAYVVGVLKALSQNGLTGFNYAFATSSSVPTLAYFSSGQYDDMVEIWENHLHGDRFVRYSNLICGLTQRYKEYPLLNLDYLVYKVFAERVPLRLEEVKGSNIECFFTVADARTGEPVYFTNRSEDLLKVIYACLSLPGACPSEVEIDGAFYTDGGIADVIPVKKALDLGCTHLLIVLTQMKGYKKKRLSDAELLIFRNYFKNASVGVMRAIQNRHIMYNETINYISQREAGTLLPNGGEKSTVVLRPKAKPPAGKITKNRKKIVETLNMGYEDAREMLDSIERLFN